MPNHNPTTTNNVAVSNLGNAQCFEIIWQANDAAPRPLPAFDGAVVLIENPEYKDIGDTVVNSGNLYFGTRRIQRHQLATRENTGQLLLKRTEFLYLRPVRNIANTFHALVTIWPIEDETTRGENYAENY